MCEFILFLAAVLEDFASAWAKDANNALHLNTVNFNEI